MPLARRLLAEATKHNIQWYLRSEIAAATKPPVGRRRLVLAGALLFNLEVPVVEVHGGNIWIARVDNAGDAASKEGHHLA